MRQRKKSRNFGVNRNSGLWKNWRQPTLAESIKPLPSARLCLTAEFGMGSGRTTALWPPKSNQFKTNVQYAVFSIQYSEEYRARMEQPFELNLKELCRETPVL